MKFDSVQIIFNYRGKTKEEYIKNHIKFLIDLGYKITSNYNNIINYSHKNKNYSTIFT